MKSLKLMPELTFETFKPAFETGPHKAINLYTRVIHAQAKQKKKLK